MGMRIFFCFVFLLGTVGVYSCGGGGVHLRGGGATFPHPLYEKWLSVYNQKTKGVNINYQPVGSGSGQKSLSSDLFHFAGSDVFMDSSLQKEMESKGHKVVHMPTVLGAVVVAYNLDVEGELKLSNEALVGIFKGDITQWNDKRLLADNPFLAGVDVPITVVYRSDASGETENFTRYLSAVSADWAKEIGSAKSIKWPSKSAVGNKYNSGVAQSIHSQEGAIGYVSLNYTQSTGTKVAALSSKNGKWVQANTQTVEGILNGVEIDFQNPVFLYEVGNPDGYPISVTTYVLYCNDLNYRGNSKKEAQALVDFLRWTMSDEAQNMSGDLHYVSLSPSVRQENLEILKEVTFGKEKLN